MLPRLRHATTQTIVIYNNVAQPNVPFNVADMALFTAQVRPDEGLGFLGMFIAL
jgi:hypothetical protein